MLVYVLGLFCINLWLLYPIYSASRGVEHTKLHEILFFLGMALANIPGAFIYWFMYRRTSRVIHTGRSQRSVDTELIFIALIFVYEVLTISLASTMAASVWQQATLLFVLLLLYVNHNLMPGAKVALSVLAVLGIVLVNQWSGTTDYRISIIAVTLAILNEYPLSVVKWLALLSLGIYIGISSTALWLVQGVGLKGIVVFAMRNVITYSMIVFLFYIGKKQLMLVEELKRTAIQLKEKNQRMEELQLMAERNRIAREIHDTLGHTLTGALIQLEAAKKVIPVDEERSLAIVERTQEVIRDGFSDVKRAIHALRPMIIEDCTLKEALTDLAQRVESEFEVAVSLQVEDELDLGEDQRVALYRMTQEGVTNSMRHGKASSIRIDIRKEQNTVRLVLEDDGIGCAHITAGYGLTGIRERVQTLKGQMTVKSKPKQGFMMMVCIPHHLIP